LVFFPCFSLPVSQYLFVLLLLFFFFSVVHRSRLADFMSCIMRVIIILTILCFLFVCFCFFISVLVITCMLYYYSWYAVSNLLCSCFCASVASIMCLLVTVHFNESQDSFAWGCHGEGWRIQVQFPSCFFLISYLYHYTCTYLTWPVLRTHHRTSFSSLLQSLG
jgi:hypothetical protein